MARTNKEFYFCFAQYYNAQTETNAIITSYTNDRDSLSSENVCKRYVNLDLLQEAEFHKYTFRYDPTKAESERIALYLDGSLLTTFPEPTSRVVDLPYDFVYFTLSPRLFENPEHSDNSALFASGRVLLKYIKIYNHANAAYTGTNLEVPLHGQHTGTTCSCASQRMILEYYGVTVAEEDIAEKSKDIASKSLGSSSYFNSAENFPLVMNHFLPVTAPEYSTEQLYSLMPSQIAEDIQNEYSDYRYLQKITESIDKGAPVAVLLRTNNSTEEISAWGYSTEGHWVVVRGYDYNATQGCYVFQICDPADPTKQFTEDSGRIFSVRYSVLRRLNYRKSAHVVGNF